MHGAPGEAFLIHLASLSALVVGLEARGRALLGHFSCTRRSRKSWGLCPAQLYPLKLTNTWRMQGCTASCPVGPQEGGGDRGTQVGVLEGLGRNKILTGSEAPAGSTGQEGGYTRKYTLPKSLKSGRDLDGREEGSGKP